MPIIKIPIALGPGTDFPLGTVGMRLQVPFLEGPPFITWPDLGGAGMGCVPHRF